MAAGHEHAYFLTRDGQVHSWGLGGSGKLGHGGLWDEPVPRLITALAKRRCIGIACGANHAGLYVHACEIDSGRSQAFNSDTHILILVAHALRIITQVPSQTTGRCGLGETTVLAS